MSDFDEAGDLQILIRLLADSSAELRALKKEMKGMDSLVQQAQRDERKAQEALINAMNAKVILEQRLGAMEAKLDE